MSDKIHIELGDVQKTLLLPLWGRAVETQKSTPLLIDHTATEIMKKIDYDFTEGTKNLSAISQLGWIVRSFHIDTMIKQLIEKHPTATIVNIGCGLDTTFDRIDNGRLSWYDVDLPDVITLRRKFIPEHERRTFIASSFLSHDWLNQLNIQEKVLCIAAGVLYYFEEHQIKEFLTHIAEVFPGGEMVFDASSPVGIRMANKMVIKASGMDEKSFLKWGLKHAKALELWDRWIKLVDEYPMFRAMMSRFQLKNKIMAWISDVFKIQYMVHVQFVKS
jgi:O-methyltransferase involved in polyketide biosynthesis